VFAALALAVLAWGCGLYVAAFGSSSAAAAIGAIVLGIAFIYYSAQALLFGAEIISARAQRRGRPISSHLEDSPGGDNTYPTTRDAEPPRPRRGGSQALPSLAAASPDALILRVAVLSSSR